MTAPIVEARAWTPDVATTLDVVAAEIELSAARCIFLDRVVAEVMEGLPPDQRTRLVEGLHAVDLLAQHLAGLSTFVRGVSAASPEGLGVPVSAALSDITLGALAERISVGLGGEYVRRAGPAADSGDVDLF
jgi:hypothetical protein